MPPITNLVAEIGVIVYPDVQLAAVYGLTDLFRIAGDHAELREPSNPAAIRVTHWRQAATGTGVERIFDSHPGMPSKPNHLIAPPSLIMPARMNRMSGLANWLTERHAEGATLCSVCAGAFLLGETGLLAGRDATTHWAFADTLAERFPTIKVDVDRMVIDDGDIITAGGIFAWTDLGLTLVERFLGPSIMLDTARFLLIDPPGRSQRPYNHFVPRLDHGDAAILKVQHWLHASGGKDHTVRTLAGMAHLEERTFLRRFRKATALRPTEYAQQIRIAKAREALELSRRSIEQIAWDVGYGDPAAFRKLFQRVTGLAPADYRRRFGIAA
jgi:transcriptional regulator GlxA family with amidase domain